MKFNAIDQRMLLGFGAAMAVLLAMAAFNFRATRAFSGNTASLASSQEIITLLDSMLLDVATAQRDQRDSMLTGQPLYLERCQDALMGVNQSLSKVRGLLASQGRHSEIVDSFDPLLADQVKFITQTLSLKKGSDPRGAGALAQTEEASRRMERVQNLVATARDNEIRAMHDKTVEGEIRSREALAMIVVGLVLNLFLFVGVYLYIHRETLLRMLAEASLTKNGEILSSILHNMGDGVMVVGLDGTFMVANPSVQRIFGKKVKKLDPEMDGWGMFHDDHSTPLTYRELPIVRAMHGEEADDIDVFVKNEQVPQGAYLSVNCRPLRDAADKLLGGIVVFRDMTQKKTDHEALEESNRKLLRTVVELERNNLEVDQLAKLVENLQACQSSAEIARACLPMLRSLFAETPGVLMEMDSSHSNLNLLAEWDNITPPDTVLSFHDCWAMRRGRPHIVMDKENVGMYCGHLSVKTAESLCVPLVAQGELLGLLSLNSREKGVMDERTVNLANLASEQLALAIANLRLRETLRHESISDTLTGLFNRRYFDDTSRLEYSRAERSSRNLSLLMIDIDHFKLFNDQFGHDAGDTVLRQVGKELRNSVRKVDTVCRYGGEEMVCLLPDTGIEAARICAEKIRLAVERLRPTLAAGETTPVTVSIGVASYPSHSSSLAELLKHSDEALYEAKNAGRNRVMEWRSDNMKAA